MRNSTLSMNDSYKGNVVLDGGLQHHPESCSEAKQNGGNECGSLKGTESESLEERKSQTKLEEILAGRSGKLYDRLYETQTLLDAYRRPERELLLLCGPPGTGKTALAHHTLKDHVERDGGFFISGKFDQLQRCEPFTPLIAAFTEFVNLQLQREVEDTVMIRERILAALDSDEIGILSNMIPCVKQLVGMTDDAEESIVRDSNSHSRLKRALRLFVRAICSPQRPLVLFLDDLQWADPSSVDLFKTLVAETDSPDFMLIGACRANDVSPAHQLSVLLRELEGDGVDITEVSLSNLKRDGVHEMLNDLLGRSAAETKPLLEIVSRCTNCNAFFVSYFLRYMYDEGLLEAEPHSGRWIWSNDIVLRHFDRLDVLQFVRNTMEALPDAVQDVLKVASCIGTDFDEHILCGVVALAGDVISALGISKDKGLVSVNNMSGGYRFAHDIIQQAAYTLIPTTDLEAFHLCLGRQLCVALEAEDLDKHIFLAANQFRIGASLINDTDERHRTAQLCLSAGEKASRMSAFATAAEYLSLGISLLGDRHWRDEYALSLALFDAAAEVEYCNARFDRVKGLVDDVIANARSFGDQLCAYTTKVYSLGTLNQPQEAMATGLEVLSKLGQTFPKKLTKFRFIAEFAKTKRMLRKKTMDEIMELSPMKSREQLAAMRMMHVLYLHAFTYKPELAPMLSFRMVQMTLNHGLSGMSSPGFSSYGLFLSCLFRSFDDAFKYGQLSLEMLDQFPGRQWLPRTYVSVYGMINTWKAPFRESLEPLRLGHRTGLASGDIQIAMLNAAVYVTCAICAGVPLNALYRETESFRDMMRRYRQDQMITLLKPSLQLIATFMGLSPASVVTAGNHVDMDIEIKKAEETGNISVLTTYCRYQCILWYFMNDYSLAANWAKRCHSYREKTVSAYKNVPLACYEALAALALARASRRKRHHMAQARRSLKTLRRYASFSRPNCKNKVLLVEAELAVVTSDNLDLAIEKYRESIEAARIEGILNEQALACERAGLTLREAGRETEAQDFLVEARRVYECWGSALKVEQLRGLVAFQSKSIALAV